MRRVRYYSQFRPSMASFGTYLAEIRRTACGRKQYIYAVNIDVNDENVCAEYLPAIKTYNRQCYLLRRFSIVKVRLQFVRAKCSFPFRRTMNNTILKQCCTLYQPYSVTRNRNPGAYDRDLVDVSVIV
ncbi:hypothetical protein Tcan_01700, partial [Toxocara canis]